MEKPMAPDERDRSFDKALARHLRSTQPARDSATPPEIPASRGGACPDPETLAAYHERSLFSEQMNFLKEHIVGCGDCQSILAHLEATGGVSLQAAEQQKVSRKESGLVMAAGNLETLPATRASRQRQIAAGASSSRKSRRALLLSGARWQWLAPAGALAAGLLVWIALHENRPLAPPALNEIQVAKNQPLPSPAPSAPRAQQEISQVAKAAPAKPSSKAD